MTALDAKMLDRAKRYGWNIVDNKGELEYLPKNILHVDDLYQRSITSNRRVVDIARDWSYLACGALIVVQRSDGTYYVVDGQHRKLAADKRDEITMLACIVFRVHDVKDEAMGFVRANTVRGNIRTLEKFKAKLVAQDPTALDIKALVEEVGYRIGPSKMLESISCVSLLEKYYAADKVRLRKSLRVAAVVCRPQPIHNRLVQGLFTLERWLLDKDSRWSIVDRESISKLSDVGQSAILKKIAEASSLHGKGGDRMCAIGVAMILNHRRHTSNRIDYPGAM
jgi:hypothetical protein